MVENKLRKAAYKVIESEGLPKPEKITFRYATKRIQRRSGSCIKQTSKINNNCIKYRISLILTKHIYFKDDKGIYLNDNNKRCSRKIKFRSKESLIRIMAHEIAHLKFWNHSPEHMLYTNHLIEKLNVEYEEM